MQCTTVNGSSVKKKKDKIHWGPRCHRNWRYSLLPIINGGFCYYSILETSLSPVLHCRMQHRLPIHKYFITTGCCVSSRQITLGLIHSSPNSCCPVREAELFSLFPLQPPFTRCEALYIPEPGRAASLWPCFQILTFIPYAPSSFPKGQAGLCLRHLSSSGLCCLSESLGWQSGRTLGFPSWFCKVLAELRVPHGSMQTHRLPRRVRERGEVSLCCPGMCSHGGCWCWLVLRFPVLSR